nr:N-6 DNA methylase [Helicobacter japonicus]
MLSNPPYSVKGFLSNLDKALNAFSLSQSIDSKSYDKNNAIECFFVERAKQFLKEGGYFALILPVSILQKGGIYEKTRELLLAHFKLLCLVELNSRTFGSTGTQTIILFAKRVKKYDEDLISRLKDSNFSDEALSDDFNDENFLKNYCEFMGYDYESFKKFMRESILEDNLKNSSIFKEYLADYESSKPKVFKKQKLSENDKKALFEKSSFFKDLDSKTHKKQYGEFLKSDAYNKAEENLRFQNFLNQVKDLECEKMLYFAYIKDEKVLILKSPSDKNKEGKSNKANIVKFLGYDWSNRKGDEGIKYITNKPIDSELKESDEDSDEEKKQKEVLRNINSVKFIQTPLYNPTNKEDSTKLAYALKSFMEQDSNNALSLDNLLESLQSNEQDSYTLFSTQCKDLLDFSRAEFSKAISLNPKNLTIFSNPFENSKFKLVRLGEVLVDIINGSTPSTKINEYWNSKDIHWLTTPDFKENVFIENTS